MGIAMLIPGVSGGTMILAMGLYNEFINSIAEVTALRFSRRRLVFLSVLGACAGSSIVGLAGVILFLLFHHGSAMYALFIGLTLGGAPLLAKSLRPVRADVLAALIAGLGLMVGVFMLRHGRGLPHNTGMDLVSGVVGSTTMVLPGISGSYMLLVMDQYDRVIGTIEDLRTAVGSGDADSLRRAAGIIVPVGIGMVAGIVGLSNVLKLLLRRFERLTIGFLLGMLLGSVMGLWPFGRPPLEGALARRDPAELVAFADRHGIETAGVLDQDRLVACILDGWDDRAVNDFAPSSIAVAGVMVVGGFLVTFVLARRGAGLGRPGPDS